MKKYYVLCIAGQSNAVGYDESYVTFPEYTNTAPDRIHQLGFFGQDNLKLLPLDYCAQSMQNMKYFNRPYSEFPGTKGIHLPLANLILPKLPEDYGLLILSVAYGGSGFTSGVDGTYDETLKKPVPADEAGGCGLLKWGKDTAYYKTLRDRIKYALSLHPENRFLGILWCQGENDSSDAKGHENGFCEMTASLFQELNESGFADRVKKGSWDKDLWFNMETVAYWYQVGECQKIWDNYRKWNPKTYVEIPRSTTSNQTNGTGQTAMNLEAHFGGDAYYHTVAPKVFQKMEECGVFQFDQK